ncbi:MAG: hypothetical protein GX098_10885 [Bacteroidales bacterium]|nr:hypothetical protein [Bacteroidales bacterium]
MDKSIKWNKNYDFAMLDMMQDFTDEELKELGMSDEKIAEFRVYQKEHPIQD